MHIVFPIARTFDIIEETGIDGGDKEFDARGEHGAPFLEVFVAADDYVVEHVFCEAKETEPLADHDVDRFGELEVCRVAMDNFDCI